MGFKGKTPHIEQMDFGLGKVTSVGVCSRRDEVGLVFAPAARKGGCFSRKYAWKDG
jgi:hypothetical protein